MNPRAIELPRLNGCFRSDSQTAPQPSILGEQEKIDAFHSSQKSLHHRPLGTGRSLEGLSSRRSLDSLGREKMRLIRLKVHNGL
jgi:hypothetical protein